MVRLGPVYRVKPGETLAGLAGRFRTTVRRVLALNPDVDLARALAPGQPLCLALCAP